MVVAAIAATFLAHSIISFGPPGASCKAALTAFGSVSGRPRAAHVGIRMRPLRTPVHTQLERGDGQNKGFLTLFTDISHSGPDPRAMRAAQAKAGAGDATRLLHALGDSPGLGHRVSLFPN